MIKLSQKNNSTVLCCTSMSIPVTKQENAFKPLVKLFTLTKQPLTTRARQWKEY